ncbi:MAG: hypothetical protein ABL894_10970 [Hyphomicrobium sp.]
MIRGLVKRAATATAGGLAYTASAMAGTPPEIRISATNQVPACVTPERLMAFLKTRNHSLDPRFKDIASFYKAHGEGWNVRWDYAFFQMAIETNFLTYKRPDGHWGDVDPKQNNFAGIGTTGGGVPGDKFPDVKTGVLGQIQHLVAYSGERMAEPVAARTQLKQDDIVLESRKLGRAVRFSDLARRWAVDPKYGASIEWVADAYRSEHCRGGDGKQADLKATEKEVLPWAVAGAAPSLSGIKKPGEPARAVSKSAPASPTPVLAVQPQSAVRTVWVSSPRGQPKGAAAMTSEIATTNVKAPLPVTVAAADTAVGGKVPAAEPAVLPAKFDAAATPPSGLGAKPSLESRSQPCRVSSASYGGKKTLLIRAAVDGEHRYTALTVLDGFEKSMTESFLKTRAPNGEMLGEFPDQRAAIARAQELCPAS